MAPILGIEVDKICNKGDEDGSDTCPHLITGKDGCEESSINFLPLGDNVVWARNSRYKLHCCLHSSSFPFLPTVGPARALFGRPRR